MKRITPHTPENEIADWIEEQLKEVNLKVEHIIYRLRYEDPRIWLAENERKDKKIARNINLWLGLFFYPCLFDQNRRFLNEFIFSSLLKFRDSTFEDHPKMTSYRKPCESVGFEFKGVGGLSELQLKDGKKGGFLAEWDEILGG